MAIEVCVVVGKLATVTLPCRECPGHDRDSRAGPDAG